MKNLILIAISTLAFYALEAQTAEVEVHHAEFECRNCSNTGFSDHVVRVARVIDGDETRLEKQIRYCPSIHFNKPQKACNNTNYRLCEFEVVSEKDCTVQLNYDGVDFTPFSSDDLITQASRSAEILLIIKNCR